MSRICHIGGFEQELEPASLGLEAYTDELHEKVMAESDTQEARTALDTARLAAQDALAAVAWEEEAQEVEVEIDEQAREEETGVQSRIVLRRRERATAGRAASVFDPADAAAMPQRGKRTNTWDIKVGASANERNPGACRAVAAGA